MVTYEVNLTINNDIFDDYYNWLLEHVQAMLQFEGFERAEISKEKEGSPNSTNVTTRYYIKNEQSLNDYLNNHAPKMREDGIKKFGTKFSATRRVFIETMTIEN